jgi:WD40 repeat protein
MSQPPFAALVAALGLAAVAAAQTPPTQAPARRTVVDVSPAGAFLREAHGRAAPRPATDVAGLTAPGTLWTHTDAGLAWIGNAASIGDRGTQVLVEYDLNNEATELFSVFDANPPTALWSDGSALGTEARMVASADAVDTHVAIHQVVVGGPTARQAVLRKYSSGSATPDWSYTFTPVIDDAAKVGISRDGQTIVAALMNDSTFDVEIAVFGPGSGTPLSYTAVPVGANNYLRGFDLSADGSTLYFSAGAIAHVFDVASTSVVFTTGIGASFDSHAISGDGSVFAFGNFNLLSVWQRSSGGYVKAFEATRPGSVYCARVDISDDGSTIGAGWYFYSPGLTVVLETRDVATQSLLMADTVTGTGGYQNVVADVSCSADGARVAFGLWGDQGGLAEEVRLYDRDDPEPVVTFDTPGSVFDIDLSADGQRVVAASKAVHANSLGSGGRIDLVDAGGEDVFLRGSPRLGASVTVEVHGTPGRSAFLLTSLGQAANPFTYPGIGTLYIDRATLTIGPLGTIPAGGVVSMALTLPANPALLGQPLYYQGLEALPRRLTSDWVKATLLP